MEQNSIPLDEVFTLYQGVREGLIVGCRRCKGMTFFPFTGGAFSTIDAWCTMHEMWCPAVIQQAIDRVH